LLRKSFGVLAASLPATAFASDPTGLFVLFIALPAVIAGALSLPISYWVPKFGAAVTGLLLALHAPLVWWAKDVGYMQSSGGWIYASLRDLASCRVS